MARLVAERADALPALAEAFREHGFEGASLSLLTRHTGLSKGSLYHFFPGGKAEMAEAVLAHIDQWFETHIFIPLEQENDARAALDHMIASVSGYFRSGRRICLVGAFALNETRDRFAKAIRAYFTRWIKALSQALQRGGLDRASADRAAEDAMFRIQGGLVMARAQDDPALFSRALAHLHDDLTRMVGT
ncbi:TetR/AcrR family transcriptional regulator [Yunchengibacter salinarum]|uniref:TetR/AcrR family transcriptional regulator n=1 Tax=Yunchengibacter salinarum TaxID=3133399 RepID=UPI0035B5ED89